MLRLTGVLGNIHGDAALREQCERLSALGKQEVLLLETRDTQKTRLRAVTDKGTEVGIVLERGRALRDGDILYLSEPDCAIVVQVKPEDVMAITLDSTPTRGELIANAVRLGHILGNQHWPVYVEGETVYVPVSIAQNVMETVLKTYNVQGIQYRFTQARIDGLPSTAHGATAHGTSTEHPHPHD